MIAFLKILTWIQTWGQKKPFKHWIVFITGHLVFISLTIHKEKMKWKNRCILMILIILISNQNFLQHNHKNNLLMINLMTFISFKMKIEIKYWIVGGLRDTTTLMIIIIFKFYMKTLKWVSIKNLFLLIKIQEMKAL